jgi:hypothetical protein
MRKQSSRDTTKEELQRLYDQSWQFLMSRGAAARKVQWSCLVYEGDER